MSMKIKKIRDAIGVGSSVASELYVLGNDIDMVIDASRASTGLDQCKAEVINRRFSKSEDEIRVLRHRVNALEQRMSVLEDEINALSV